MILVRRAVRKSGIVCTDSPRRSSSAIRFDSYTSDAFCIGLLGYDWRLGLIVIKVGCLRCEGRRNWYWCKEQREETVNTQTLLCCLGGTARKSKFSVAILFLDFQISYVYRLTDIKNFRFKSSRFSKFRHFQDLQDSQFFKLSSLESFSLSNFPIYKVSICHIVKFTKF